MRTQLRTPHSASAAQGRVAAYAKATRWRRSFIGTLDRSGHSHAEASSPEGLHRLLLDQRFDVLVLRVRDEAEADDLRSVLESVRQPAHTIVVGDADALPLLPIRRAATYRFLPGRASAEELGHLVDVSISSGTWNETSDENGADLELQEVDLEEVVEQAATTVYAGARRKHQRFHSLVTGDYRYVLADPTLLRHAIADLLRLAVTLAPTRALISLEAEAGRREWQVQLRVSGGNRLQRKPTHFAEAVCQETKALASIARALTKQGGMFWVELLGLSGLAFSFTLPLPPEEAQSA